MNGYPRSYQVDRLLEALRISPASLSSHLLKLSHLIIYITDDVALLPDLCYCPRSSFLGGSNKTLHFSSLLHALYNSLHTREVHCHSAHIYLVVVFWANQDRVASSPCSIEKADWYSLCSQHSVGQRSNVSKAMVSQDFLKMYRSFVRNPAL